MTSGEEIKRQVMEALDNAECGMDVAEYEALLDARAALAPCVVLTAEERERVREICEAGHSWLDYNAYDATDARVALAILSPDETGQAGDASPAATSAGVDDSAAAEDVPQAPALLSPDPEIFAPRDPHTYVTHEPPSSGAGARGIETGTVQPLAGQPAPDTIGPPSSGEGGSLPAVESGALRRADPAPDDIGPPAPGEGDDLPNPEIGMGVLMTPEEEANLLQAVSHLQQAQHDTNETIKTLLDSVWILSSLVRPGVDREAAASDVGGRHGG